MPAIALPPPLWLPPPPALIRPASPELVRSARRLDAQERRAGLVPMLPFYSATAYATRTFLATTTSTATGTTYTFSSQALGTASGTSLVVVVVHVYNTGINGTVLSTVSIDGTNGTIHQNANSILAGGGGCIAAVASRATSNTSGTIVVTTNNNCTGCAISVFRVNSLTSATVFGGNAVASSASNITSRSTTLDVPAKGLIFAGASWYTPNSSPAYTVGVNQDASAMNGASSTQSYALGTNQNMGAETGRTVTATNSAGWAALAVASWR